MRHILEVCWYIWYIIIIYHTYHWVFLATDDMHNSHYRIYIKESKCVPIQKAGQRFGAIFVFTLILNAILTRHLPVSLEAMTLMWHPCNYEHQNYKPYSLYRCIHSTNITSGKRKLINWPRYIHDMHMCMHRNIVFQMLMWNTTYII